MKPLGDAIHPIDHFLCFFQSVVARHVDEATNSISLESREGDEAEVASFPVTNEGHRDRDKGGERNVSVVQCEVENGLKDLVHEVFETVGDRLLKALKGIEFLFVAVGF